MKNWNELIINDLMKLQLENQKGRQINIHIIGAC